MRIVTHRKIQIRVVMIMIAILAVSSIDCKHDSDVNSPAENADVFTSINFPIFSKSGNKILFFATLRSSPEGDGFYEVDTAGGKAHLLLKDSLAKLQPVLSPNGQKIAYRAALVGRQWCCAHIWVMNVDGSDAKDLTPSGGFWDRQRWSPDDLKLTFDGPVEHAGVVKNQISLINSDGSNPTFLTSGDTGSSDARWSSDGSKIFYGTENRLDPLSDEVFVMDPDGSNKLPLDSTHQGSSRARSSPTRTEILIWGMARTPQLGVYRLQYGALSLPTGQTSFESFGLLAPADEWSPDGNLVAGRRGVSSTRIDLFMMNRDGTNVRRLTNDLYVTSFTWSPDNRHIILESAINSTEFYIVDTQLLTVKKLKITP